MKLAIFDFDNTITRQDSLIDFIYHAIGPVRFLSSSIYLSPLLIGHQLGLISSARTKEIVLSHFFKDWKQDKLNSIASRYSRDILPLIVRASALQKLHWHQSQNHKIVIVSASLEIYLMDWCQSINAELLATGLDFKEGRFTGKLSTPNCKGPEKLRRIQEHYDLKAFEYIYAYGDSPSDLVQKNIANEFHYRSFQ
jgi:phosphatidylglycerophosphatase C